MATLIELRKNIEVILTGGTICTGKDTAADEAERLLKENNYNTVRVCLTDYIRSVAGLKKEDPREKYCALFEGKLNNPWLLKGVARKTKVKAGSAVIITGLRRECDARYLHNTFRNAYFMILTCDEDVLARRIAERGRAGTDFPEGAPLDERIIIAKGLLKEEERIHKITMMEDYVMERVQPRRNLIIDTSMQETKEDFKYRIDRKVETALKLFRLI